MSRHGFEARPKVALRLKALEPEKARLRVIAKSSAVLIETRTRKCCEKRFFRVSSLLIIKKIEILEVRLVEPYKFGDRSGLFPRFSTQTCLENKLARSNSYRIITPYLKRSTGHVPGGSLVALVKC